MLRTRLVAEEKHGNNQNDKPDEDECRQYAEQHRGGLFGGTDGSSTPTPVIVLGGITEWPDEACGSRSFSHSLNSQGMTQIPVRSKEAENCFDCNPSLERALICIATRAEFPAAHGLHGALVQSKTNASNHSNIRRPSVSANQHA